MRSGVLLSATVLGMAALLLAGCGDEEDQGASAVRVVGIDYSFEMPDTIQGGAVTMNFVNDGGTPHEFALGRLDPGKTLEDLDAVLARGDEPPSWAHDIGGVPPMTQGEEISISRQLRPGTYAFLCFIPVAGGAKSHYDLGMKREFTIEGDSGESLPEPDAVITARDERLDVPPIEAGEQTIELRNDASRGREFELSSFEPGKGPEDAQEWFRSGFRGEPPLQLLGAMQTIPAGTSVFLTANFESGREYFVTDPENRQRAKFTPN